MMGNVKVIFWDFDGVILDSNEIRETGFREILKDYDIGLVDKLIQYHRLNGGKSRYVKLRFFFEEIVKRKTSNQEIVELANEFSDIMLSLLKNKELLIPDTVEFIRENYKRFTFHIVSGSDGKELSKLCDYLGISNFFHQIEGSPTPKIELVRRIISDFGHLIDECVLIGDSINDHEAAGANGIEFYGYNNKSLKNLGTRYIESFEDLFLNSDL